MMNLVFWARNASEPHLEGLESWLTSSLSPVEPDPAFVGRLRDRLLTPSPVSVEQCRRDRIIFVRVALMLVAGASLVWLISRMLRSRSG